MTADPVYTADRVKRLRTVLWVVVGAGGLLLLLAFYILVALLPDAAGDENLGSALFVVTVAGVALLSSGFISMRMLPGPRKPAKASLVGTGITLIVVGILMNGTAIIGFVLPMLGLVVLLLALLPDGDPA